MYTEIIYQGEENVTCCSLSWRSTSAWERVKQVVGHVRRRSGGPASGWAVSGRSSGWKWRKKTYIYIYQKGLPWGLLKHTFEEIQAFVFLLCFLKCSVSESIGTLCLRRPGCALLVPFNTESLSKGLIDWLVAVASLADSPEKKFVPNKKRKRHLAS